MFHNLYSFVFKAVTRSRFVLLSFFLITNFCDAQNLPPRKIGVILPLSGPFSPSGTTVRNSLELAQKENPNLISLIFEDDSFEPKNTVTAVRKLIESDHVDGLIVWGTPTGLSVNEIAEKAKVPLLVFSMLDKVVEKKNYVLKHWLPSTSINVAVGEEIKRRNINSVSLVVLANDAMLKLKESFEANPPAKILSSIEFPKSEADFKIDALKIKSLNPDAVYVLLWAPQLSLFVKQLRDVGYKGAIFGTQNFEDLNEVKAAKGALENSWFLGTDDSQASSYYEKYKTAYLGSPVAGGTNAYDVARMFQDCSKSSDLNKCLHSVKDFSGTLGTYSSTANNDFSLVPLLKCIKDGKITSRCK